MRDPDRDEIAELIAQAAPALPRETRPRALAAMATPRPEPTPRWRLALTTGAVALVLFATAFVPYSANDREAHLAAAMAAASSQAAAEPPVQDDDPEVSRALAPYRSRAIAFVKEHYPNDPRMQLAAGLLASDHAAGEALLRETAEKAGRPELWAAYVWRLHRNTPGYMRVGQIIQDPELPNREEVLAQYRRDVNPVSPDRLSPKDAAPALAAIARWKRADPKNAMPLVLEMRYLYGLHRDREALARWREAAQRPIVEGYYNETTKANFLLLYRMGSPDIDALSSSIPYADAPGFSGLLRDAARIAAYEGRVAQLAGRPQDAIAWWDGAIAVGRNMQQSARTGIDLLVGIAVEGIGGAPAWKWYPGRSVGFPAAPLIGGLFFYGKQHDYYVRLAGEKASTQLRDDLVRGKLRSMVMREYYANVFVLDPLLRLRTLGVFAAAALLLLGVLAAVYLGAGTWRRALADAATTLTWRARLLVAVLPLLPAAIGGVVFWRLPPTVPQPGEVPTPTAPFLQAALFGAGLSLAVLLALLLPLLAARWTRQPGARLLTAWRGNLRRVLPVVVVTCAVAALALAITSKQMRKHWIEDWTSPTHSELAPIVAHFGDRWTHPPVPPDSWRAEYPKLVKP